MSENAADDWVPCVSGALPDLKRLLAKCEEAGIPAGLWAEEACDKHGGCGCGPKVHLVAAESDLPRVAALMKQEWAHAVAKEGTVEEWDMGADEDAPCPACGTKGDLVEGACAECGLQLV